MSPNGTLEYAEASSSSAFTTITAESSHLPRGVSLMQFSSGGEFLATVDQNQPNAVWIWSLGASTRLESVLVHEHNVRHISWCPSAEELVITTNNSAFAAILVWSNTTNPIIAGVPITRNEAGRYDISWVKPTIRGEPPLFWFSTADDAVLGHVSVRENGSGCFNMLHSASALVGLPAMSGTYQT
jgi:WD40 repeat protein